MQVATAATSARVPATMVEDIAIQTAERLGIASPKAIVVFAAPDVAHEELLLLLRRRWPEAAIVGSSSAGEFADGGLDEAHVSVLAIGGEDVSVSAVIGRGRASDTADVARQIATGFSAQNDHARPYRSALVMADALSGRMDELVHDLTVATGGEHKFFGGGAGDNAGFVRTPVFCGTEVVSDAAVALEFRSSKPVGVGACHGWKPASEPFRVTEAVGTRLVSLDGLPAVTAFEDHAFATGQSFDPGAPIPFFLSNILGIATAGPHRLRVPLQVHGDGSITCAAQIPTGALVTIMASTAADTISAAQEATMAAVADLGGQAAGGALMFDCVATRLRLAEAASDEIDAVRGLLPGLPLAGCHTHGQVVRSLGQFATFQNCTAVVCLLPN